ncbi:MAG: ligand-binding protein SH3 [Thermoplasmata archaeon]|nr:MAG: ligand-binding protein SH3 [Thermoplasmata archaeon]HEC88958.1 ligand-binding protein SH3 [Thermoplasmatales archaeon]
MPIQIPEWAQIFLMSMIPGIEARLTVPFIAIGEFGWPWWKAFPIAIAGNMFLVPFILLFFRKVELFLRRYPTWSRAMDWGFPLIRRRADDKVRKYETAALIIFVAIPLPFTGAGLGSLIAYLFNFRIWESVFMILIGVIISTSITTTLFLVGKEVFIIGG